MSRFRTSFTIAAAVSATALLASSGVNATLTVDATVGGAPTGVNYVNFDNLPLGNSGGTSDGVSVSFTGTGQAVQGSVSGLYAAPYLSNNNGALFGDPNNGPDTTTYVVAGTGSVKIVFPGQEEYVGLLWGSVDSFNTLDLYDGSTLVGSITGTDVTASADGDQGANGTYYVNIDSTLPFDRIVALSSQNTFEIDDLAYNSSVANVPEPISLSLLGGGLVAAAGVARRRKQRKSI